MEFAFSEEQTELASTVRSLLGKRADPRLADYDQELWQTLCEQIGVAALGIPEDYDGAGFSLFESLIVLEEIGRSLAPSPLLSSLVTAEALLAGADDDAKQRLLPRIAAGEIAAIALDVQQPTLDIDHAAHRPRRRRRRPGRGRPPRRQSGSSPWTRRSGSAGCSTPPRPP